MKICKIISAFTSYFKNINASYEKKPINTQFKKINK